MTGFTDLLESWAARASRALRRPALVASIVRKGETFDTAFYAQDFTLGEMEATATDLLKAVRDEIPEGDGCSHCAARRLRVIAALHQLESGEHALIDTAAKRDLH